VGGIYSFKSNITGEHDIDHLADELGDVSVYFVVTVVIKQRTIFMISQTIRWTDLRHFKEN